MRLQNIAMLILAAAAGAGAGVASSSYARLSLDAYSARLLDERRFAALLPARTSVADTAGDGVRAVREEGFRSTALFYASSTLSGTADHWQASGAAQGVGVVVSGDGWILTTTDAVDAPTTKEAMVQGQRYKLGKVIKDTRSGFALVHLEGASSLSTVTFGGSLLLAEGDGLIVGDAVQGLSVATLLRVNAVRPTDKAVHQAETYYRHWEISQAFKNTILWNNSGEMVGLIGRDGVPLPLHEGGGFAQEVIRTDKPAHAALGAYLVDIAGVVNISTDLTHGRLQGELISAPLSGRPAIMATGPADKAGLKLNDLIVAVDTVPVGGTRSVAALLGDYDPGEIANLTILRGTETIAVPVTLGDVQTLVY